tara:strand:- start:325 stop:540 length:216 start_codon:yes stop_codon:yes gene_type:complete
MRTTAINQKDSIYISKRRKIIIEAYKDCIVCRENQDQQKQDLIEGQLKLSDVKVTFYIHENCKARIIERLF